MKSLTESILGSNRAGIDVSIRNWLEENNVIKNNEYKIKNHIIYPNDDVDVQLFDRDYNELPEYIQFADGSYSLIIGDILHASHEKRSKEIKSFRGLPKNVSRLGIGFNKKNIKLPELNIKTSRVRIWDGNVIINNKLNITHDDKYIFTPKTEKSVVFDTFINCKERTKSTFQGFRVMETNLHTKCINDEISYMLLKDDINYIIDNPTKNVELSKYTSELVDELCERIGFDESINVICFYISPKIYIGDIRAYLYKDKGGVWHASRVIPIHH